jgi:predicted alpha/beta-hydrolase family hydrolase
MPSLTPIQQPDLGGWLHEPGATLSGAIGLTHGAGGNANNPFLQALAAELCAGGWLVLRYDLPFRRDGKTPNPRQAVQDREGIRAAAAFLRRYQPPILALGGQSYGGRQTSLAAAESPALASALVLLSYPLHPPGKPEQLRTDHFPDLEQPCLFVQGTRDPFATPDELRAAAAAIRTRVTLRWIEQAGHSLPPASARGVADCTSEFLRTLS